MAFGNVFRHETNKIVFKVSYVEIYLEEMNDLLSLGKFSKYISLVTLIRTITPSQTNNCYMFVMQVDTCGQLSGKTGSTGIRVYFLSLSVLKSVNSFTGICLLCLLLLTLRLLL